MTYGFATLPRHGHDDGSHPSSPYYRPEAVGNEHEINAAVQDLILVGSVLSYTLGGVYPMDRLKGRTFEKLDRDFCYLADAIGLDDKQRDQLTITVRDGEPIERWNWIAEGIQEAFHEQLSLVEAGGESLPFEYRTALARINAIAARVSEVAA